MSLELTGREQPIFGAFWFTAKIDTDRDDDVAIIRDVEITRVSWPDSTDAGEQKFTQVVERAVPETGFEISMERLSASLASAEQEQKSLAELKNDPPAIVFSDQLAVLLLYDGEPRFTAVADSDYERAANTPFVVVRSKDTKTVYLSSGQLWFEAKDALGPWTPIDSPPADLVKLVPAPADDEPASAKTPAIETATEPTELIATDGKPNWKSLGGGELLYVVNTETPWIREVSGQQMYVLLSGRWFSASSQSGPWKFVRPDELPASFKDIPPASDIGGLRVSVAGTEEAQEAVLDAQVPQTAAIKRGEAQFDVQYDGAPKFEKIAGTSVSFAVNTGAQVLEIGGRYYAVDNGVWFASAAATGPWVVADKIPDDEIQKIPPSSPVYNTKYVHVYQSTPEVVYVGYTPGYLWSYPYYGVLVYGTGWHYRPYWGTTVYYPRPPTWGLHVGYNPWTGWSYGVSWSRGFLSVGVSWNSGGYRHGHCCNGWYGGGYRGSTIINTGDINIGNSINVGNRVNVKNRIEKDAGIRKDRLSGDNLYRRPENRARNADRATARENLKAARPATRRENNVYADKSGNVARRVGDQWETRQQSEWTPERPTTGASGPQARDRVQSAARDRPSLRPSEPPKWADRPQPAERPVQKRELSQRPQRSIDRGALDRSHQARQAGTARERARPAQRGGRQGGLRR